MIPSLDAIEAVLLDVGGVMVVPDPRLLSRVVSAHGGTTDLSVVLRAHHRGMAAGDSDGAFDWDAYHGRLLRECGVPEEQTVACLGDMQVMIAERPDLWSHVLPGVREGLAACAELLALGIVSNSNGTVEQLLRDEAICQVGPGPGVVVTCVVDSEVVGVAKPDPRVFGPAVAALRVRADNVAYVGDTRAFDLAGARAAGLTGIHVDPLELCPQRADHHHVHDLGEVAPLLARRAMASKGP